MILVDLPVALYALSLLSFALAALAGVTSRSASVRAAHPSLALSLVGLVFGGSLAVLQLGAPSAWGSELVVPGFSAAAPGITVLDFGLTGLGAVFLLLLAVVGGVVVLASLGYVARFVHERRGPLAGLIGLFLMSMELVITSQSVFLFLLAWEGMTLVSYFLVVHEHDSWEVRRAGLFYLVMSHAAAAGVLISLVLLGAGTGAWTFSSIAAGAGRLGAWQAGAVFVAALIGFGTKAGVAPLHVWLPEAHPAAPSNVSALMSGVMIKMGVYGAILVPFELLGGTPPLWWGFTWIGLGALSCLLGVLNAIAQHDLKRLLAFHSVENIGIIFLALGASLVFLSLGAPLLAALSLLAGLFHTWNHALFKALLFLGAGAATGSAGTRDMEALGGLARRMPYTALFFLGGAMAISGLPPLNGFVSEWLLFQSLFGAFTTGSLATEVVFTAVAGVLALSSGLAAYCFVKAFGVTFLARPRSEAARSVVREAPSSMTAAMGALFGLCLLLGVAPFLLLGPISTVASGLVGAPPISYSAGGAFGSLPRPGSTGGSLAIGVVALGLAAGLLVVWLLRRMGSGHAAPRGAAWDCGIDAPTPRMEYTASGYAQPILRLFGGFYRASSHLEPRGPGSPRQGSLAKTGHVEVEVEYPLVAGFYSPLTVAVQSLARRVSRLQSGGIHAYLGYMVLTLIGLLVILRIAGGGAP
ncbi:MAG: hydrogenase 4 subunit B [Euryarchaeota archaeon]|nr:hydrogenase 4 subunit B [Euryarchaeota archaeon]MDE2045917.1 hydrogenase 4 subunit B [Thermoplasmata archaeon]